MNIVFFTLGCAFLILLLYWIGNHFINTYIWAHQSEKAYPTYYRDWQYRDANKKTSTTKGVINAML